MHKHFDLGAQDRRSFDVHGSGGASTTATATATATPGRGDVARKKKSLISRALERCRSGLLIGRRRGGRRTTAAPVAAAGCFPVYVGPERERFVVRAEFAGHPLFRRLLDDAEREYGHAPPGPLALPCAVDAFLDVLWHMEHDGDGDGDGDDSPTTAVVSSPICGFVRSGSKGGAAGYRMLSPRPSPAVAMRWPAGAGALQESSNRQTDPREILSENAAVCRLNQR
ncbi:hypothetical protein ACP4OV_006858 [Aristida adscensionis]